MAIQRLVYIQKNPALTLQQFYDHWQNKHAPLVKDWAKRYGTTGYQQIHATGFIVPTDTEGNKLGEVMNYDGIAMFELESEDDWSEAVKDEFYINVIEPDEHKFINKAGHGRGILQYSFGKLVKIYTPKAVET